MRSCSWPRERVTRAALPCQHLTSPGHGRVWHSIYIVKTLPLHIHGRARYTYSIARHSRTSAMACGHALASLHRRLPAEPEAATASSTPGTKAPVHAADHCRAGSSSPTATWAAAAWREGRRRATAASDGGGDGSDGGDGGGDSGGSESGGARVVAAMARAARRRGWLR